MSAPMEGKVVLVTGGGTGIGRASALAFAAEGASVVVADVADDAGAETVELVRTEGSEALYVHTDVTRRDEVAAMVAACVDSFGRLDYAHNNAGMSGAAAGVAELSEE